MISGELSSYNIDAELAQLLADTEAWMAANGVETAAPPAEPPAPAGEAPADPPPPEAVSETEAPGEVLDAPDFGIDGYILSVGQSLGGSEFVFIF